MKAKRITAAAAALVIGSTMTIQASAMTELDPTDVPHKFDIGSMDAGGSGVEADEETGIGRNWIKVIQPFNEAMLFYDTAEPDIAAVAVTFEISNWSGKDYDIGWGALLTYYDGSGNWYGYDDFKGNSDYTITGDGEYTLVCDLGKFCIAQDQPYGLAMLQALEMVINDVEEGDPTTIEVKSARIYMAGEPVESAVLPDGTEIPIETAAILTGDEEETEGSAAESAAEEAGEDTGTEEAPADSAAEEKETAAETTAAVKEDKDSKDEDSGEGTSKGIIFGAIAAAAAAVIAVIAVLKSKKK